MDPLAALTQQFDPLRPLQANEQDNQLYVDWERELRADEDVKRKLARGFARSGRVRVALLVTGHRGVGKTTELLRVKYAVENRPRGEKSFVAYLQAEKWLDLGDIN
jgi:predicted AAA+ superfamily ATPase